MSVRSFGRPLAAFLVALTVVFASVTSAFAENTEYKLGQDSLVNTGTDTGFSKSDTLDKNDVHWGWQLGDFYLTNFTRVTETSDGTPVFLKNVGDKTTLWFELEQDIDRLNDNDQLAIAEDKNGWDRRFKVAQQNFGRGMLIVKHTDYTNNSQTTLYSDFLAAKASKTAATKVEVLEEGDYEVALDYEIQVPRVDVFGWTPAYQYTNYQILFKFSVRNGNSMVFPFDVKTGDEMTNASATANGFRLDLAKSRYLDIDIRREVLGESADGLVEDTRFNRPAKDGGEYVDEGVYTITVSNRYTGEETTKTIYVGADDVLKAHAATGRSVAAINALVADGATIAEDGSIIPVQGPPIEAEFDEASELPGSDGEAGESGDASIAGANGTLIDASATWLSPEILGIALIASLLTILLVLLGKRRRSQRKTSPAAESDDL